MVRLFTPSPAPTVESPYRTRMRAEQLEPRETPSGSVGELPLLQQARDRYAVGTSGGGVAQVNVYDAPTGALLGILNPFGTGYTGAVSVATGDVTGDGIKDVVVAAGRGHTPDVKVFDGRTLKEIGSFRPYSDTFFGGVTVAVGDVTSDGRADIVTGAGVGSAPHVKSFSGADLFSTTGKQLTTKPAVRHNFFAWESTNRGGVTVAVGDVNGDGRGDIVVGQGPGRGGVRAFSGTNGATLLDLKPFGDTFDLGVSVAVGDVTGDGKADVVAGAMRGDAHVKVFHGNGTEAAAFTAFDGRVGTRVAIQDVDRDGVGDVLVAASGGRPAVKIVAGLTGTVKRSFPAMMPNYTSGLTVG